MTTKRMKSFRHALEGLATALKDQPNFVFQFCVALIGRENKVDPKPYIDSGRFAKPNSSYSGGDCSQGGTCNYGDITTRFGQVYFLGQHSGLDIADFYGSPIYAAEDGEAYTTQDTKACYLTGTVGKGVFVDHKNGIVTLYWHIP